MYSLLYLYTLFHSFTILFLSLSLSLSLSLNSKAAMKSNHHQQSKLKTQLFSCGFFRHCTQTVLSPTATATPPSLPLSSDRRNPLPPPPPPPTQNDMSFPTPPPKKPDTPSTSSSSSSSSSASHSFTQWKFPLSHSPVRADPTRLEPVFRTDPGHDAAVDIREVFHSAELRLSSGTEAERAAGLHMLEWSLVPDPAAAGAECPAGLMRGVAAGLRGGAAAARAASKVLLALCLAEGNRRVAVEAGAAAAVVEAAPELEGAAAERAMAALELMCTVPEGAAAVRSHALAVPVMVAAMGRASPREKEYAISVLAVIYGGSGGEEAEAETATAPAEEVARAVALALQGECSARGRRKGLQLLKTLQESGTHQTTVV